MKANELIEKIKGGALSKYSALYPDVDEQKQRYVKAIEEFVKLFGAGEDLFLFSVPGRTEILGNHTDHNRGCVLAGAVNRDIIAVVSKNNTGTVRLKSEGFKENTVDLSKMGVCDAYEKYSSNSLILGLLAGFRDKGYEVGSFNAYTTTTVLKGSGLSSSAAFEVMIGNILNHLYNGGKIDNGEIAKISQFSENVYFGKPCGLMDQMACAVGGFVFIDFKDNANPKVKPIDFMLSDYGYSVCVVNTGGNHANLNDDYASVPAEMKAVAHYFGKEVLRDVTMGEIISNASVLREALGDRAVLRAMHFMQENERVKSSAEALENKDVDAFLSKVIESGNSSFKYLQNVYTTINVKEQGLSLALAITDTLLSGKGCAFRVHGGGFAGTIQAFVKNEYVEEYTKIMDSVFGNGAAMRLSIRPLGAIAVEI